MRIAKSYCIMQNEAPLWLEKLYPAWCAGCAVAMRVHGQLTAPSRFWIECVYMCAPGWRAARNVLARLVNF
jgi:hypothetical protein